MIGSWRLVHKAGGCSAPAGMGNADAVGAPGKTSGAMGIGRHEQVVRRSSQRLDAVPHRELHS